jgi:hypothetical protein
MSTHISVNLNHNKIADHSDGVEKPLAPSSLHNFNSNLTADESEDNILEYLRAAAGIAVLNQLVKIDPFT